MKRDRNKGSGDAVARKKPYRFNFIDVLIILLVIAIIFVAINVIAPMPFVKQLQAEKKLTVQYTIELSGVEEAYLNKIKENDSVVDAVSKNSLGTVLAVDYNNYYSELAYDEETGEGKLVEYTDRYDVTVTIVASGVYNEGEGYSVNATRIAVGEKIYVRFPNYVGAGYCIGFSAN